MKEQNRQRKEERARLRWALVTIVVLLVVSAILALFSSETVSPRTLFSGQGPVLEQVASYLPESWRIALFPNLEDEGFLQATGVIQADQVAVASTSGGLVATIPVSVGDEVRLNETLVQLDVSSLEDQIMAAQAGVAWAEAGLAQAQAGPRPGQIAIAEAQLAQAETARIAATQTFSDAVALVENPQDILLQIVVTRAQLQAAEYKEAQAQALKDAAEMAKNKFEEVQAEWGDQGQTKVLVGSGAIVDLPPDIRDQLPGLLDGVYRFRDLEVHLDHGAYTIYKWVRINIPLQFHLTPNDWWQAWVGLNAAAAQREGYQSSLAQLYDQYAEPQSLEAQLDQAISAIAQAEAQVRAAQAQLDGLKGGASEAQLNALEARVEQAQTALDSLVDQKEMMTITSPMGGTVLDVIVRPGEVVAPGAALVKVATLSTVHLTVYVPENQIGRVRVGQEVQVTADAFPDHAFSGRVTRIADRAEFTPRNVATKEERVNLVFAVEIELANQDGKLKPGMAAEAQFMVDE